MGRWLFLAGVCASILSPSYGQVYLIQASPTPKYQGGYPTTLLQLSGDGSIRSAAQVLPGGRDGGTEWIDVSYAARKAVFLSKLPSHRIVVVDLDSASVVKSCEPPPPPAGMVDYPFKEWLADIPGRGLTYVEHLATPALTAQDLATQISAPREMLVDPALPCAESFPESSRQNAKFLVTSGDAGVADLGINGRKDVRIEKNGALSLIFLGGERSYLDYRIPDGVMASIANPGAQVAISNQEVFGVALRDFDHRNAPVRLLLFRKRDDTWHEVPGVAASFVRGFGSFAAIAEAEPKTPQNPESPGVSEWRKTETATGPSIEERLKNLPNVLPGKLDLYDVATEKMYHITTNQGDSEILLVDNNTVYYRVSDRLYSAAIGKDGLEPAKLLATSESIRDVHWAFVKH
jgi:hypothetical protein